MGRGHRRSSYRGLSRRHLVAAVTIGEDFQRFDRCYWRRVAFLIFISFCLALLLLPLLANAEPRLRAEQGGVVITLYDEPCELKDQIANLPYKATWEEKGKVYR